MEIYRTLKFNDIGDDVHELQTQLAQLGLILPKYINGVFAEATESAVCLFQRDKGLAIDGKVGRETERALRAELERKDK